MSLQLFAHPFSSYCQKVLIALWSDGTAFEYRLLEQDHPENMAELKSRWPFGQFPLLVDKGRTVVETTCIIEHLQAAHQGPNTWIPEGETGRLVRFLDRFFDLYVMNTMTVPVFNAIRPEDQRDPFGVERALTQLRIAYDWLEINLGEGPWAAGEQFTLAD
nr:glutathione S-transferase family protein [Sphingomonas sp.]